MKFSSWPLHVLSIEVRKLVSYRIDFWVQFLGTVGVYALVAYYMWRSVYTAAGTNMIGGYTFDAMILYYVLVPLVEKCIRGQDMGLISPDIYDGSFTRYLVYPVSALGYKYMAHLAFSLVGVIQFFLGLALALLFFKIPPDVKFSVPSMLMGFSAMFLSGILYFFINACLELVSFWTDTVWSLLVMLKFITSLLGGALVPLSLFPDWARKIIDLSPFPYFASFPIQTVMGHVDFHSWMIGLGMTVFWIFVMWTLCSLILGRGLLRYTGVGI